MRPSLSVIIAMAALATTSAAASAETESFDSTAVGALPAGWLPGLTGRGAPHWQVIADATAPSAPNVLNQSGSGTFPWVVRKGVALVDGYVETRFKSISGKEDQAGGVVWRFKDASTYYVARANANEDNVSLYYTTLGIRSTIKSVSTPVTRNAWHTLRVEFSGRTMRVFFNGKLAIDAQDGHIEDAGTVGLWTKADSVTSFDNFSYGGR